MTDLFQDKAADWDQRPVPQQISEGVFAAIDRHVTLGPDLTVMDFGAGTGLVTARLAPRVGKILAVDVSPAMLEQLGQKPELAGKAEIVCQDLTRAPLGRTVDLVVSAMAMHHVQDTAALARALAAHLAPGGRIALADLDAEDGSFHPPEAEGVFHAGFDRDALGATLRAAGFIDVQFVTACTVDKGDRRYPIFLVTAHTPAA
ncbi:MAG: methyltransferase domain-containing protein [Kofleriaceae bacterium]|nr:methyltransferase domain-containing protein [Kofleriaceae bacterium]MBP6837044.1 methyltransferase domain-containing protein [Kofleriaceae bacterium]MBP9203457.1 methyltransferase domain-containing protein [Kofleriaceae bacterium]